jgi:hypothetical protein
MNYTYFNRGVPTPFNPDKKTTVLGQTMTTLELHKDLVREAGRRDVYILDHKGREVDCSLPVAVAA